MVALPTAAPPLADRIEHAFIANGFKSPGDRLPSERELAGMFGVSRTVVREALKTLVERKVVDVWVGRGVFIRKATPADAADPVASLLQRQGMTARQMIEARSMLEVEASRLACLRASAEELELMSQVIGRADEASTLLERVRDDLQFHLLVVRSAHNPVIETMFSAILRPTAEMMVRSISDINVSREGLPYHKQIWRAIRKRDELGAARATRGHLLVGERMYGPDLDVELDILVRRRLGAVPSEEIGAELLGSTDLIAMILSQVLSFRAWTTGR